MEIYEGLRLMMIGMSTVVAFLCLLVVVMHLSAVFFRFYHRAFPEIEEVAPKSKATSQRDVAIALAVVVHQKNLQRGA